MTDLIRTDSAKVSVRIVIAIVVLITLAVCLYAISWQIGDMLAVLTPSTDERASDVAGMADSLAPSDPLVSYLTAATTDSPTEALSWYERTVALSPEDPQWRVELARAYEQAGRLTDAEAQFREAVARAPRYAKPHWYLANYLLRQGRTDEALSELSLAARDNHLYRDQVFSLAWDYFDHDPKYLIELAGDGEMARAQLTTFFGAHGEAAAALATWSSISDAGQQQFSYYAAPLPAAFYVRKAYPESLEIAKQLGIETDAAPEAVTNGSFEMPIRDDPQALFDWHVTPSLPTVEIVSDSRVRHSGQRSIRINFKGALKGAFQDLTQTVVVSPGRRYNLSFWLKTENLKSAGQPLLQVVAASDGHSLARTHTFPATTDWQQVSVEVDVPSDVTAIIISTARDSCDDCPISGTLWYDDFQLASATASQQ